MGVVFVNVRVTQMIKRSELDTEVFCKEWAAGPALCRITLSNPKQQGSGELAHTTQPSCAARDGSQTRAGWGQGAALTLSHSSKSLLTVKYWTGSETLAQNLQWGRETSYFVCYGSQREVFCFPASPHSQNCDKKVVSKLHFRNYSKFFTH